MIATVPALSWRMRRARHGPGRPAVLDHRPDDRLHVAQRVLRLAEHAGADRLERAGVRALHDGTPDYPTLKRILATGLERAPLPPVQPPPPPRTLTF
jgi:hypothetical protein